MTTLPRNAITSRLKKLGLLKTNKTSPTDDGNIETIF